MLAIESTMPRTMFLFELNISAMELGCISPSCAPCSRRHRLHRAAGRAGKHAVRRQAFLRISKQVRMTHTRNSIACRLKGTTHGSSKDLAFVSELDGATSR